MRLTSNFPNTVFWRMFEKTNTTYVTGYWEGLINRGESRDLFHPHGQFQLELKHGWLLGPFIMRPGQVFDNDDVLILNANGTVTIQQPPDIEVIEDSTVTIPFGREITFLDALGSATDVTRSVKTSVTSVNERTAGVQEENFLKQSANFELGLKAEIKASDQFTASGNIGADTAREISSKLNSSYTQRFSQAVTTETSTTVVAKAGILTAVVFEWHRHVAKGRVIMEGETYPYVATVGFTPVNTKVSSHQNFAAMPADLRDAYTKGRDLATIWSLAPVNVPGGKKPQRFNGAGWAALDGGLVEIDGSSDGNVWGVNDSQGIFRRENGGWAQIAGGATDVSVSRNGEAWVIGTDAEPGGFGIHRYTGSAFVKVPGGATRIGLSDEGTPWVVNDQQQIFRRNGSNWEVLDGAARDIAVGSGDDAWVIGTNPEPGGFGIYRRANGGWQAIPGGAVRIGMDAMNAPWIVNDQNAILRWDGSQFQPVSGEAVAI